MSSCPADIYARDRDGTGRVGSGTSRTKIPKLWDLEDDFYPSNVYLLKSLSILIFYNFIQKNLWEIGWGKKNSLRLHSIINEIFFHQILSTYMKKMSISSIIYNITLSVNEFIATSSWLIFYSIFPRFIGRKYFTSIF